MAAGTSGYGQDQLLTSTTVWKALIRLDAAVGQEGARFIGALAVIAGHLL